MGMYLPQAIKYLEDVLQHKQAIPVRVYNGGHGRHAQGHMMKAPGNQVFWPKKATNFYLGLLRNAEANAEAKGNDPANMRITHVQPNRAPQLRRRTYRAHGRITPYKSNPAHIEIICTDASEPVEKAEEEKRPAKLSRKQLAMRRLKAGGGVTA